MCPRSDHPSPLLARLCRLLPKGRKNSGGEAAALLFDESVDDIPAVFAEVWEDKRDMHPAAAGLGILFPYQLVKR